MQIKGVSQVAESRLREEIMTGKIAPGERINEIAVSERFGVSRPPLREAMRRLESENLVFSIPRRGSYAAQTSKEDCIHIYRARIMLECGAVDIINEEGGVDFGTLERALVEEKKLQTRRGKTKDPHEDYIIMSQFHNALVEACGNRWVVHYHQQLRSTLGRYQIMYLTIPGGYGQSLKEHDEVLQMIKSGAYGEAKMAMRTHIERTLEVLVPQIPESKE